MRKRTNLFAPRIVFIGFFAAVFFLLNGASVQAQAGRLKARQTGKLGKQIAEPTSTTQERSAPANNEPAAQANRPKVMQQALQPANPRLNAIVLDRFLPRLDLSEEQRTQILAVRLQHIRKLRTLIEMERVHSRAYDEALFDLSLDTKEIEKRTAQLAEIRTDMLNAQAKLFLDLRRLLTSEQFTKLRQMMEEERALKRNAP